jgi:hypothetical protein
VIRAVQKRKPELWRRELRGRQAFGGRTRKEKNVKTSSGEPAIDGERILEIETASARQPREREGLDGVPAVRKKKLSKPKNRGLQRRCDKASRRAPLETDWKRKPRRNPRRVARRAFGRKSREEQTTSAPLLHEKISQIKHRRRGEFSERERSSSRGRLTESQTKIEVTRKTSARR